MAEADWDRGDDDDGELRRRHSRRRRRRNVPWKALVALAVFVVLMVAAYEVARLAPALRSLNDGAAVLQDASTALGTSPGEWTDQRIKFSQGLAQEARREIAPARDKVKSDPTLRVVRHLPILGDQVQAVFDLADAADAGSRALEDLVQVAQVYQRSSGDQSPPGPKLLSLIASSSGPLSDADAVLAPPLKALRADLGKRLLPPIRQKLQRGVDTLGPVATRAHSGAGAGKYAPDALGATVPRTYLLLLPNPAELRPAGGFSGAVGTITFTRGAPTSIVIKSQDQYNKPPRRPFDVPYPLARYFSFKPGTMEIGDAGWDPDFPSTAKLSEDMFVAETGQKVDGTISIDPYAISALLTITGPVDVPGYGTFDSATFFPRLDQIVNVQHGPGTGKDALPPIAKAILNKALTQPLTAYPRILSAFQDQGHRRHLQVSIHSPGLAAAAAGVHYDGALLDQRDDYVMIVDGNVGATKGDYYVKKSAQLRAEVPASGLSRHQLTLSYDMPPPVDDVDRALNPGQGSYNDFVRVYLPESANLVNLEYRLDGQPAKEGGLDSVSNDHGKRVIAVFFRLPRGHKAEVKINYLVGLRGGNGYDLLVQKQAGIPGYPVNLDISYPAGGLVSRRVDLSQDIDVAVHW